VDQIDTFLQTLLNGSPEQYRGIAENALTIYRGGGRLTVKLHAWALKAAKAQGVTVPDDFHEVEVFEPKNNRYVQYHAMTQQAVLVAPHDEADDTLGIITVALIELAHVLTSTAERLKAR
jgi:hypothetical protein